jgi:hypothetical protein
MPGAPIERDAHEWTRTTTGREAHQALNRNLAFWGGGVGVQIHLSIGVSDDREHRRM